MDSNLQDRITHAIGRDLTRKALTAYFIKKGYDPLTMLVYPPSIIDITEMIPSLSDKMALKQSADEIDPQTGVAKIRWDLFVNGIHRICLGQTTHTNLADVANPSSANENLAKPRHTAIEIINFIIKVLDNTKDGFSRNIMQGVNQPAVPSNRPRIGPGASSGYYEKNRSI